MNAAQFFKDNSYIYLSNVISRQEASELTNHMFALRDSGKMQKDEQCPLSDSVYGDPILDGLLERLAPSLSAQLGIELLPTYTYARIYAPGETLVRHKDRPSCEISGTMTLGFDPGSGIWPIFFGKNDDDLAGQSMEINTGDLVMYRGCDLNHWRPEYKGKWQAQIFFHYVDANGPNAQHAMDGRQQLGTNKHNTVEDNSQATLVNTAQPVSRLIPDGVMIKTADMIFPGAATYWSEFRPEMAFSADECEKVLEQANKLYPRKSTVGTGPDGGEYRPEIRAVDTYEILHTEETSWIFEKISHAVALANADYYRYNLLGITHGLQLLHYKSEENGHYDWHMDCGDGDACTRKISISIPLTKRNEYEGGDLEINNNGTLIKATDEQGSITLFPSYLMHRVSPVTKGERWVIVIWIHGPDRFK